MKEKNEFESRTIKGKRFMICQNSIPGGKYWEGVKCNNWSEVGNRTTAVLCPACTNKLVDAPDIGNYYTPTGHPRGWQFMKVYVDTEGNVYHKGVVQPNLKGTLPITVIDNTPKKKLTNQEKQDLRDTLLTQMLVVRGEINKATLKKDVRTKQSELKRIERQLKKL
jgi:hypothetical protein